MNMKILSLFFGIVLVSGCIGQYDQQPAQEQGTSAETNNVEIRDFAFNPSTIAITKGTTVAWTNQDSTMHTVIADNSDSGNLGKGDLWIHTFNEAGTFDYICAIHPYMKGKIIVE